MQLMYLAHQGADLTPTTPATVHPDRLPIILAMSVVAGVAIFIISRLLSAAENLEAKEPTKKGLKK